MSTPELKTATPRPEVITREVPRRRPAWIEIATSTDHKQIGVLYIATALAFCVLAVTELALMRLQLIVPDNTMIDYTIFDQLLSAYGVTGVVLFALPFAFGLATFIVPLQVGARGTALPRLGALSWWLYLAGGLAIYASFLYTPPDAGTFAFPPLSDDAFSPSNGADAWIAGVALAVAGLVCAAVNIVVTVGRMRAPGMAWRRLPLFSWSATVMSYLMLVAGPILLAALTMLFYDRSFDGVFFEAGERGAPLLFQHLSWIFYTSAYLAVVIFAVGVLAEIVPTFARKPIFSHGAIAAAIAAVAALGFFAWMQNMYSADVRIGFDYFAMVFALALLVPLGVIFFNLVATLWGGSLQMRPPLLFALGAISATSFGLAGELGYSVIPVGWQLSNTATAWQDTHYVLIGGSVLAGFAALHYWFPKITGRLMSEALARMSFWAIFAGMQLMLFPMFFAGLEGQPADVSEYFDGTGLAGWNLVAAIGAFGLAAGIIMTLVNAVRSVRHGTVVGPDPWSGTTLEWFTLSPPPAHNFDAIPDVRSTEPLEDIRRAVRDRDFGAAVPTPMSPPPAAEPEMEPEPATEPEVDAGVGPAAEPAAEPDPQVEPEGEQEDEAGADGGGDDGGAPVA